MEQNSRVRSLSHFHFEHSNPNSPQKNTRPGIQQGRDEGSSMDMASNLLNQKEQFCGPVNQKWTIQE
ncbi:hypothetical protein HPP92_014168 [Vanilla planifolia]|uniref:Uncharacterized protein n=1 Tax=Vanilla planifolia TaxID=51239 RepID=A0A835R0T0_VANPL|nr:hypothetical protein HPP92_014168 [Vanilla planifolia]